jgi:peptidoglycan hydrolase CwlO-like protein
MKTAHVLRHVSRLASAALAASLFVTGVFPMPAIALTSDELQAEVDDAQAKIDDLNSEAEQTGYELIDAQASLQDTQDSIASVQSEIASKQSELDQAQSELSQVVASSYKTGDVNLLSVLMNSKSFDEFVSLIHYADKVSEYQQGVVSEVKTLKSQLEDEQTQLESQQQQEQEEVQALSDKKQASEAAIQAAEDYKDQLSEEVKEKIAEEEEAARQQALAQSQQTETTLQASSSTAATSSDSGGSSAEATSETGSEGSADYSADEGSSGSNTTSSARSATSSASEMVARAMEARGSHYTYSGYIWTGSTSTSYFTCSGLVDFALGRLSHSDSPESLYAQVGPSMVYSISELNYGDLVFFNWAGRSPGHVGIYLGNGEMIDADGSSVVVRGVTTSSFIGGGPII